MKIEFRCTTCNALCVTVRRPDWNQAQVDQFEQNTVCDCGGSVEGAEASEE